MARFLLIHGSCHGAWCWRDLIPHLEALGHEATAIDLPSHGADTTPAGEVTLELYAEAIVAALTPGTILVGHSMAGYPITAAAQRAPDRIARLVYLCAYVPRPGYSLSQMRHLAPRQPLVEAIRMAEDGVTFTIDPAMAVEKFYHDVATATAAWAVGQLCPQPVLPQQTAMEAGPPADLPRSYIRCRADHAIPPEFQDTLTEGWPEGTVFDLPTSHSPFLSAPKALAQLLDRIAATP